MYFHWHRRDLRAADNRALRSAVEAAQSAVSDRDELRADLGTLDREL